MTSDLDGIKSTFERKLDQHTQQSQLRLDADLAALRKQLSRIATLSLPTGISRQFKKFDKKLEAKSRLSFNASQPIFIQPLLNLGGSTPLRELDAAFAGFFNLGSYYHTMALSYPTVYCESLEEFFTPLVESLNLSPQARERELNRLIVDVEETAHQTGGGVFGYHLPGVGCYLNGWLFVYGRGLSPHDALEHPELLLRVVGTAAHEKLGHGFLSTYSALGRVKSELGITLLETARRFGLRHVDNPVDSLRRAQAQVLGMASQLVEEGWATWVEQFMLQEKPSEYPLSTILEAVKRVPARSREPEETRNALLIALHTLFGEERSGFSDILQAVMIIEVLGSDLDDYFSSILGRPLRYVVGESLFRQAAANLGPVCVPYVALIAANIHIDPQVISLSDLREMLSTQPRLNPDARLAVLSRLLLESKNDVSELARRAESELSFSVPNELKD